MIRTLLTTLAVLLTLSFVPAQTASWSSYGTVCPATTAKLQVTGLPKLGTSFSVSGISFPAFCTRKFCGCNVGPCNDCSGSVLFLGLKKINFKLGACPLLQSADMFFTANFPGTITFKVPNQPALIGQKFHLQRGDLSLKEYITASCGKRYQPVKFNGFSNGMTGTLGL